MNSKPLAIVLLVSLLSSLSFANATFVNFDFAKMEGAKEQTTKAMISAVQKEIVEQCQAISSEDLVVVVSEKVTDREVHQIFVTDQPRRCVSTDLPCNGVSRAVRTADIFRSSKLVLRRMNKDKTAAYDIEVSTNWDYDLPAPQPEATIKSSDYCTYRGMIEN